MSTATPEGSELSQQSQIVLIVAGASVVLFVGVLFYGVLNCVRTVLGFLGPAPTAAKGKARPAKVSSGKVKASDSESDVPAASASGKERGPDLKSLIKAEKTAAKKKGVSKEDHLAAHELFLNTLKDHADTVHSVAWSRDGTLLASACEDMQLRLFDLGEVSNKNPKFKRVRTARIPVGVGFGDSADALAAAMRGTPDAMVALYAPVVKQAGEAPQYDAKWTVGNVHGKETVLAMASVPSEQAVGRRGFIVSLSTKKDGKVYDMQGREMAVFEPNALTNHDLAVSLDGRFVAAATFSSDVKIWEMKYSREGEFRGLIKAMGLTGHKSQVASVALSHDNRRAATASKDGMLKIWNIDVRYEMSEDPKVVLSVPMPLPEGRVYQRMAFGPPGSDMLAASHEGTVHLLSLRTGELLERIDAHDSTITCIRWCPLPRQLGPEAGGAAAFVFATASRDKRVRVWRAPKL
ncbi:hypothetical protein HYH03_018585 [Edaphochlamys debaryana]|uniref:Anaphase-promoting complex subunit 4-like WD40 domain-containing protein n=1 Tax=Edaphochlamys debaryana TaxID=47281 RepID=A0A835XEB8_9CHLO|nr:hypothetical protein HYH03_018585 [Edaphochlamys debaryana]|eukprot:KAG2482478.1 hypothetical protein HYH03_018585 [Edaphochlamys debaryana]